MLLANGLPIGSGAQSPLAAATPSRPISKQGVGIGGFSLGGESFSAKGSHIRLHHVSSNSSSPNDHLRRFLTRVVEPDLNVNSGVYAAIDPGLRMRMNTRGEYEYIGLCDSARKHARDFLLVSAFGGASETEDKIAERRFGASDVSNDPIVGVYRGLYAGHVLEGDFRTNGSSGGMASWVLSELIRTRRVDGVIHIVRSRASDRLFEYRISHSVEEVEAGAKSRYYPGQLADVLRAVYESGGRYALTAIPSFAYEVRLLQQAVPEFDTCIPYVIGLVCGHQKTANYAAQLAWRVGIEPGNLEDIDFRSKDASASATKYLMEMRGTVDNDCVTRHARQGEILGSDWGHGLFKSNFSDFTEDAFNETADIVLGDAWLPRYVNDSAGTNIVIVRNAELDILIREAREQGRLSLDDCSVEDMLNSQAALVKQSVRELPARFRDITSAGGYAPKPRRSDDIDSVSFARRRVQRSRLILSRLSHDAWAAAIERGDLHVFDNILAAELRRYRFWQEMTRVHKLPSRVVSRVVRVVKTRSKQAR